MATSALASSSVNLNDAASVTSSSSGPASSLPDVTNFSALARRSLTDALDGIAGAKTLVLDAALSGPLGLVAEMSLLRDHGVDRIFWLEPGALSQAQKNIVYVCRPEIDLMKIIADHIKAAPAALNHTYTVLLTPRVTSVCASTLEDFGVLGSVELHEFPMSLIPLERDVLSLQVPGGGYREIFLDSNYDPIYEMGRALLTLQRAFGLIPRILGKGDAARRLVDIMFRLRSELPSSSSVSSPGAGLSSYGPIDSLIVLDRQTDMVSPLCTQLTYEGLIDEVMGIKNSFVEVDASITNPVPPTPSSSTAPQFGGTAPPPRKKKHLLSTLGASGASSSAGMHAQGQPSQAGAAAGGAPPGAGDPLFADLRDKNFTVIGELLHRIAKRINTDYEERHKAQTVGQIREFVGRLSGLQAEHQALRLHTALSEQILGTTRSDEFNRVLEVQQNIVAGLDLQVQEAAIRELINQEANVAAVLRLLCLYSLVSGGIKPRTLEEIKRDILQTYGYEYLPLLISLSDLSLLTKSAGTKSAFATSRRPLKLVVDDVDESNPHDISYVYSGYAPISVRLVQHALGLGNSSGSGSSGAGGFNLAGMTGAVTGSSNSGTREKSGATVTGWKGIDEVMRTLSGAVFEEYQKTDDGKPPTSMSSNYKPGSAAGSKFAGSDQLPVTVVCYLGGCTYTELAALRFTSQRMSGRKLLVVTTGMLNGNTIMDSLGPPKR